jgi:hypothetical protein
MCTLSRVDLHKYTAVYWGLSENIVEGVGGNDGGRRLSASLESFSQSLISPLVSSDSQLVMEDTRSGEPPHFFSYVITASYPPCEKHVCNIN